MSDKEFADKWFAPVLELVEDGRTISQALKLVGMPRNSFYHRMSELQKKTLKGLKTLNSTWGHFHRPIGLRKGDYFDEL